MSDIARYIDADALKKRLEDFSKWCRDGRKQGVDFVLDCLLPDIPTADVVPRAEVKELIREHKSPAKTVNKASELIRKLRSKVEESETKAAPTVSKMEQVRSEVVREIFAEADKIFMATCLSLETYNAWCELKKKYTERSDDIGGQL